MSHALLGDGRLPALIEGLAHGAQILEFQGAFVETPGEGRQAAGAGWRRRTAARHNVVVPARDRGLSPQQEAECRKRWRSRGILSPVTVDDRQADNTMGQRGPQSYPQKPIDKVNRI